MVPPKRKTLRCPICGKWIANSRYLLLHISRVHGYGRAQAYLRLKYNKLLEWMKVMKAVPMSAIAKFLGIDRKRAVSVVYTLMKYDLVRFTKLNVRGMYLYYPKGLALEDVEEAKAQFLAGVRLKDMGIYRCPFCFRRFMTERALMNHIGGAHGREKQKEYLCMIYKDIIKACKELGSFTLSQLYHHLNLKTKGEWYELYLKVLRLTHHGILTYTKPSGYRKRIYTYVGP